MTSSPDELRIVLIGKTGNGKSATGNSLLHSRTAFHSIQSGKSVTKDCKMEKATCTDIYGKQKKLLVVDTPGFFDTDTSTTNKIVEKKIASQIFEMTSPGVHAFLIVLGIGRFTPEEKETIGYIKKIFGTDAAKYCIVVFTRKDQLGEEHETIDSFINTSSDLQELVTLCGNRKFVIDNKINGELLNTETNKLIQMIDKMVKENSGTCYTNDQYIQIEEQRKKEQEKQEKDALEKKKAEEDRLIAKGREEERKKIQQEQIEKEERDRDTTGSRSNNYDGCDTLKYSMRRMPLYKGTPPIVVPNDAPSSQTRSSNGGFLGTGKRTLL